MKGTVDVSLRPVKFAFLVNPNDTKSLAKAIELNSNLWGGSYNPIVPTFQKMPAIWKKGHQAFGYTGRKVLKGYIDAFNPDFIVPVGACKKLDLKEFSQEVIDEGRLAISAKNATPDYGVGIYEVLQGFFDKEFRFKSKYPLEVVFPAFPKQNKLFFQSIFGSPSTEITKALSEHWKDALDANEINISLDNYLEQTSKFFIRKILRFDLEGKNTSGWRSGECVFLMDASNNHDIIDYWNLRAMGWSVLPVAIQGMKLPAVMKEVQDFIEEFSGVSQHNENNYIHCTILKARSVDDKQMEDFANALVLKPDPKARGSRFVMQHWYPRMWDEWARERDGVGYCDVVSKTKRHDLQDSQEEFSVKTLDPKYAHRFGGHRSDVRFANDVEIRNYSYDDVYAYVIPEGGRNLSRALSEISIDEWRFSKRTMTYLSKHKEWNMHLKFPKAEEVFTAWMKDNGLDVKLSPPGKIAKQMLKHLGGIHGINALARERIINLLKAMESGKHKNKEEVWAELSRAATEGPVEREASDLLKSLIKKKVFQLGVSLQCPVCNHGSWYDMTSLDYSIKCTNCLEEFEIPAHSPNDIKWSYKTTGPFSLPKRAEGVYPTLLTLRIFSNLFHHSPITPMLSFETKVKGKDIEVDLGLFFRESEFRKEDAARLIFAECKSENSFEKKDIDKMKILAEKFPGAILVFATLKEELSKKEIALLKPLVNKCRRYYKDEEPYNPVMILTKTELYAGWSIEEAWKEKGGKYAPFGDRQFMQNALLYFCDATQQIYLGMKLWSQFMHEHFEKRRQRAAARKPLTP